MNLDAASVNEYAGTPAARVRWAASAARILAVALPFGLGYAAEPAAHPPTTADVDAPASHFIAQCAVCHTIGGGELAASDLALVSNKPLADLKDSIELMQDNVTSRVDVAMMAEFLRAPDAGQRVEREARRQGGGGDAQATPVVGDAVAGRALFAGRTLFQNGGAACIGCHVTSDARTPGGTLGPTLAGASRKFGATRLVAACEQTPFKMMKPIYQPHPITRQEATDIAAYLTEADAASASQAWAVTPFLALAATASLLLFGMTARFYRRQLAPVVSSHQGSSLCRGSKTS